MQHWFRCGWMLLPARCFHSIVGWSKMPVIMFGKDQMDKSSTSHGANGGVLTLNRKCQIGRVHSSSLHSSSPISPSTQRRRRIVSLSV